MTIMADFNPKIPYEVMRQRQALPLDAKIAFTEMRIRQWYSHWGGDVYVSFSGGKDSTVLLDIVKRLYPDVPAVFCDTGLEYPEVRSLALDKADVVLRPDLTFKQVLEKHGYPKREAITFGQYDRHPEWSVPIGFGGELSDRNVKPLCDAFMEWCDYMEGCRDD